MDVRGETSRAPDEDALENVAGLLAATAVPKPTPIFRARAWRQFQRLLDPLGRPKPLPPPRP